MYAMNGVNQMWPRIALWCALSIIASSSSETLAQSRRTDAGAGSGRLSFLSGPGDETQQPAEEMPRSVPQEDNRKDIYERRMSLYGLVTCEDHRREDYRQGRQRAGRSGWRITFGRGRKRHDPYSSRTIVRKHRFWNVQSIRRLCRQLDRYQAGNVARTPTLVPRPWLRRAAT